MTGENIFVAKYFFSPSFILFFKYSYCVKVYLELISWHEKMMIASRS